MSSPPISGSGKHVHINLDFGSCSTNPPRLRNHTMTGASTPPSHSPTPEEDDHDQYIPLTTQRVFGAGINRQPIAFVPATSTEPALPTTTPPNPLPSTAAKYLSIVLGQTHSSESATASISESEAALGAVSTEEQLVCPICHTAITSPSHESSIAHQLSLEHSHPPSHLDRQRKGLKYLRGYGWDPDSRVGLGVQGEGIRVPIKAKEKRDTVGLGADCGEEEDGSDGMKSDGWVKRKKRVATKGDGGKVVKLNAKEVRKVEDEKKRKAERLRGAFYGEDLSQYLGPRG